MVRLLHMAVEEEDEQAELFQSHNGAIAADAR